MCELYTVGSPDLSQSIAVWVPKYFAYFLMEKTTILDYDNLLYYGTYLEGPYGIMVYI